MSRPTTKGIVRAKSPEGHYRAATIEEKTRTPHLLCEPLACRRGLSVRLGTMAATAPTSVNVLPDFSNF